MRRRLPLHGLIAIAVALSGCGSSPPAGSAPAGQASPGADTTIRLAPVDGLQLAYRTYGPAEGEPMLLIGGTGMKLVDWPEGFVRGLAGRGYRVVVYDSRDVGRSTKLDSLGAPDWAAITRAGQEGRTPPLPYTLEDLADDAVGLLSALGVEQAHVVGASQGGIIAQLVAIRHPDRVLSVAPMMAGTGNPAYAMPPQPARLTSIATPPTDTAFESLVASFQDRREALARLDVPTVVIQGDDDPIVSPEGAREAAATIPGAELVMISGMGHGLPDELVDQMVQAIVANAERAEP